MTALARVAIRGRRVRSQPRRAKEIRFIPVEMMGGIAPLLIM